MMLEFGQKERENDHFILRSNMDRSLGNMPGREKTPYKGSPAVQIWAHGPAQLPLCVAHRSSLAAMMTQVPRPCCMEFVIACHLLAKSPYGLR